MFLNPSQVKGIYPFVRIADELDGDGRHPILVVESRGDEQILVGCGIDLRSHGNVFLMSQPLTRRVGVEPCKIGEAPSQRPGPVRRLPASVFLHLG